MKPQETSHANERYWSEINEQTDFESLKAVSYSEKISYFEKIKDLAKEFLSSGKTEMACKIVHYKFSLIKSFFPHCKKGMEEFECLGQSMLGILKHDKNADFPAESKFLKGILKEMLETGNVPDEIRCELITRFCISYGIYCMNTKYYQKAIDIFKKAILVNKVVHKKHYGKQKYLNRCYYNIGSCYNYLHNPEKEKKANEKGKKFEKEYKAIKFTRENSRREPLYVSPDF